MQKIESITTCLDFSNDSFGNSLKFFIECILKIWALFFSYSTENVYMLQKCTPIKPTQKKLDCRALTSCKYFETHSGVSYTVPLFDFGYKKIGNDSDVR